MRQVVYTPVMHYVSTPAMLRCRVLLTSELEVMHQTMDD
jgi:hypothetical protein